MGQARKRGSFDERRIQALARVEKDRQAAVKRIKEMMEKAEATPVKENKYVK